MLNPLVSVIIPVYKVSEAWLWECVESVLAQTYKNIEIILVDDGSPDNCGEICDSYIKIDNRIRVIHKENGGLSDARNAGIEIATGEYISFIDSDDYVSSIFIESLLTNLINSQADISTVKCGTDFWDGKTKPVLNENTIKISDEIKTNKQALEEMLYNKISTGAPFKLYKKQIFDDIRFPKGYLYEDVVTTYRGFIKAKRIVIINDNLYAYRKRENSIIRQAFSEKKMICLTVADKLINDIMLFDSTLYVASICRAFSLVFSVFLQVPKEDEVNKKKLWDFIKKYRLKVLLDKNKLARRKNKIAALVSFTGANMTYTIGRKFGQKSSMGGQ